MISTELQWLSDFFSALGLFLDIVGFSVLASDVFSAFRSERIAWVRVRDVRRASFRRRYAFFAPEREQVQRENEEYDERLDAEQALFEREMDARAWRVQMGVGLIIVGFCLQIVGVMPFWP